MLCELVGVLKQDTAPGALIGAAQASYSVRPLVRRLKKFVAAADRTSEREIEADQLSSYPARHAARRDSK